MCGIQKRLGGFRLTLTAIFLVAMALGETAPTRAQEEVDVKSIDSSSDVDFATDVIAVLTKMGCNAGKCHGAAIGRGGFQLSLYGGNPDADYDSIVHQLQGRRVNLAHPERSLILRKPLEMVEHGGGTIFTHDDPGVEVLEKWIAEGALRSRSKTSLKLTALRLSPEQFIARKASESFRPKAEAHFSDGSTVDVTQWTVFQAEDDSAIRVDHDTQTITIERPGRHIVVSRYLNEVQSIEILSPVNHSKIRPIETENTIDRHVHRKLSILRIPTSPLADEAALIRRLSLDLTGRLPSKSLTRFLSTSPESDGLSILNSPQRRNELIDHLVESKAFDQYWTLQFCRWLRIRTPNPKIGIRQGQSPTGIKTYHQWIKEQISKRTGYDQIVRTLLTSVGEIDKVGPANFFNTEPGPGKQAELFSELFMARRLKCANCHNHPLDRWVQDDYHGLAAIFATVRNGPKIESKPDGIVIHPVTKEPANLKIPGYETSLLPETARNELAAWITGPNNPYFAEGIVNRLWKKMMGRGLVEPVDDFRATNPATHPQLLKSLTKDFVDNRYQWVETLKQIARSQTYARSLQPVHGNRQDRRFYSHALQKPFPAEVFADAISDVLGLPEVYDQFPKGTRAIELLDPSSTAQSLDVLGRCQNAGSCEESAPIVTGLSQTLHWYNGDLLNKRLRHPDGALSRHIAAGKTNAEILDHFYQAAFFRKPRNVEMNIWRDELKAASNRPEKRREILEDIAWSLINSSEFRNGR